MDVLARLLCALAAACTCASMWAGPARAAPAAPHWSILAQGIPTDFAAGGRDSYKLIVRNDGGAATARSMPVTIVDELPQALPAGLPQEVEAVAASAKARGANGNGTPPYEVRCTVASARTVRCVYEEEPEQGPILPGTAIVVTIVVTVPAGARGLSANTVSVSGGGAEQASLSEATPVGGSAPFGLSLADVEALEESGAADTQAGSHPFELTTSLAFTIGGREPGGAEAPLASAAPKDVEVTLPPGLVGDPDAVPRCSEREFEERESPDCPVDTQVGIVTPYFYGSFHSAVFPVYDVEPPPGYAGELGFSIAGIGHIPLFLALRDDAGPAHDEYALAAQLQDIPETGPLQGAILTLWGVPAAEGHDREREGTTGAGGSEAEVCQPMVQFTGGMEEATLCRSGAPARPFLTMPSACTGEALRVGVWTDSWQGSSEDFPAAGQGQAQLPALAGCGRLSLSPSLTVAPETTQAGAPSGYAVDVHVPQSEDPAGVATPDVRGVTVALPPGTVLSPSAGNGLQACGEAQFELHVLAPPSCPAASTVGTVQIGTPLLAAPLEGQLFVGAPECGPCSPADAQAGRLVRLLVAARGEGVTIKLAGRLAVDQATGRLTATFAQDPQLPLEDLRLTLEGGPGAPLANGWTCGTALSASAQLTPYGSETQVEQPSEPFELTGCPAPQFHPSFVAGTTDDQAGAFSPTTVTVSRSDEDEDLQRITVRLPQGVGAMVSKVQRCAEAQAQAAACAPQSRVGSVSVLAGPGADPLLLSGSVYLTGPYEGAPFGLAIVVGATIGPLDLGTIDVRAAVEVDPTTGALTIAGDPLPESVDGVPLQIGTVSMDIEREGFTFNPTDCDRLTTEATVTSAQGATAAVWAPFQAANCATLAFKPRLTALTHARPTKADGAYLHVKVVSDSGQANIAKLKLDLPKQLPARLQTLRKACPAGVFEANPAACPPGSVVGAATVVTPVLNNPLSGPAYLVSHGGEAFPDLEIVLQGEGVLLRLDGHTSIRRGVASSAFRALPDAPISTFDLVLAAGPHSALGSDLPKKARGSMCDQKLQMPVAITGQNGAVIKRTTTIAVSGCPRHRRRRHPSVTRGA